MKKVKLGVFVLCTCFFMLIGLSKMYAITCHQSGECIQCWDWGGWIEPNYCDSSGNNCPVEHYSCGHPEP
jgi:hypothetical protein